MLRIIDLRGKTLSRRDLFAIVPRAAAARNQAQEAAAAIVADVAERGESSLREQAAKFDGVTDYELRVPQWQLDEALASLDPDVRLALETAIERVTLASKAQVPAPTEVVIDAGAVVTQRWQPVSRVGLYVPGGKAVYPSSVVMNVVPALVAGVESVALASPPQADFGGRVHPVILAAAALLGISEVYAMGGAGAIAAFALGVPEIELEPVDVVTGPGNNFVAAAKRVVAGMVGTDAEAGATEIMVVADDSANPRWVAADLVSQAEHDEQAGSILVTDSAELANEVLAVIPQLAADTLHSQRVGVALAGEQSAIILVDDFDMACAVSNAYAPEHLELHLRDPRPELFTNAGAIFVGSFSPVSLGDYLAGSNHVLPTGGQSRFGSGLSAATFLRPQQIINFSKQALSDSASRIVTLANVEGLPAHGEAVSIRFDSE